MTLTLSSQQVGVVGKHYTEATPGSNWMYFISFMQKLVALLLLHKQTLSRCSWEIALMRMGQNWGRSDTDLSDLSPLNIQT